MLKAFPFSFAVKSINLNSILNDKHIFHELINHILLPINQLFSIQFEKHRRHRHRQQKIHEFNTFKDTCTYTYTWPQRAVY